MDKRIIAASLTALLASGCLAACASNDGRDDDMIGGSVGMAIGQSGTGSADWGAGVSDVDMADDEANDETSDESPADDEADGVAQDDAGDGDTGEPVTEQADVPSCSIDPKANVIDTPYYTIKLPDSMRGRYKARFDATDLRMTAGPDGAPSDLGLGCSTTIVLVDADDPTEPPTDADFRDSRGTYSVGMFTDNWGVQGDFSVETLGKSKVAPGWHVEVSGPADDAETTRAIAGYVTVK